MSPTIKVIKLSGLILGANSISLMANRHLKQLNNLHICGFDYMQPINTFSQKFDSISSLTISN
jgi:hypothetical protein